MKKVLAISLLIISILASLFANDFQGKVYRVKSGPSEYKNQEWQFINETLFICDTEEGKYTAYEYDVSGSTISIQGPTNSKLEDFIPSRSVSYTLSEGTAGLQIEFDGITLELFDTGREAERKALASSIADKTVALAGMASFGIANVKASKTIETDKFNETLDYVKENGGQAPEGYIGNRTFFNREGKLPTTDSSGNLINYKEYDVNPYVPGVNRGAERLIVGSNDTAFKTVDHYQTFQQINY